MKRLIALVGLLALMFMLGGAHPAGASAAVVDRHMAAGLHVPALGDLAAAPSSVTVRAGDTYGGWARRYCGTFNAWHAIQAVNGWPERRIPIGATARIVCTSTATVPTPPPTLNAGGSWVHPLASGRPGTSCYGWRASTHSFHGGVDMPQARGTVIRAVSAGEVYLKRFQSGGAGYYLVIRHPRNTFTLYAHMISASPLAIGAHVVAGQAVGNVGATGNATGPHLHFEVQQGGYGTSNRINPAPFMRSHGVNIGC